MIPRLNKNHGSPKLCLRSEDEPEVQNGLAITPSQMLELSEKGIPVSANNLGLGYEEGVSSLDFVPPLQHQRGIDIGDLWEARESVKSKVKKVAFNNDNFEKAV